MRESDEIIDGNDGDNGLYAKWRGEQDSNLMD
jgi:hypothetical protein